MKLLNMEKKRKRKAWWSNKATSPKALKNWFADRGREIKPIVTYPREVIFSRHEETMPEFIKRLEKIADQRQKEKQQRKEKLDEYIRSNIHGQKP
jgi:hypothetical protein